MTITSHDETMENFRSIRLVNPFVGKIPLTNLNDQGNKPLIDKQSIVMLRGQGCLVVTGDLMCVTFQGNPKPQTPTTYFSRPEIIKHLRYGGLPEPFINHF